MGVPGLAFLENDFCVENSWSGLAFPAVPALRNELALSASCSQLLLSLVFLPRCEEPEAHSCPRHGVD